MKQLFTLLRRIEELVLSLTFLGLAIVAVIQVICRYGFDYSFTWFEEAGRYVGIFATFLGASLGVKYGMHFSMDLLSTSVSPLIGRILKVLIGLVCGSALLILAWYGFGLVQTNLKYGNTSAAMQMPMYLAYLPLPFFCFIMAIRFYRLGLLALLGKNTNKQEQPA